MKFNTIEAHYANKEEKLYFSPGLPIYDLIKEYFGRNPYVATNNSVIPLIIGNKAVKVENVVKMSMNLISDSGLTKEVNYKLVELNTVELFINHFLAYEMNFRTKTNAMSERVYFKMPYIKREIIHIYGPVIKRGNTSLIIHMIHSIFSKVFARSSLRVIYFNTIGFLYYIGMYDYLIQISKQSGSDFSEHPDFIKDAATNLLDFMTDELADVNDKSYVVQIDENFDILKYFEDVNYDESMGFEKITQAQLDSILKLVDEYDTNYMRLNSKYLAFEKVNFRTLWSTHLNKPIIRCHDKKIIQYGEVIGEFNSETNFNLSNDQLIIKEVNKPFMPISIEGMNCTITKRKIHTSKFRGAEYFHMLLNALFHNSDEFDRINIYGMHSEDPINPLDFIDSNMNMRNEFFENFVQIDSQTVHELSNNIRDFDDDDEDEYYDSIDFLRSRSEDYAMFIFEVEICYQDEMFTNYIIFDPSDRQGIIAKSFYPDMFHIEYNSNGFGGIIYDAAYNHRTGMFEFKYDESADESFIKLFKEVGIVHESTNVYSDGARYCLEFEKNRFVDTNINGIANSDLKINRFSHDVIRKIIYGAIIKDQESLDNLNLHERAFGLSAYFEYEDEEEHNYYSVRRVLRKISRYLSEDNRTKDVDQTFCNVCQYVSLNTPTYKERDLLNIECLTSFNLQESLSREIVETMNESYVEYSFNYSSDKIDQAPLKHVMRFISAINNPNEIRLKTLESILIRYGDCNDLSELLNFCVDLYYIILENDEFNENTFASNYNVSELLYENFVKLETVASNLFFETKGLDSIEFNEMILNKKSIGQINSAIFKMVSLINLILNGYYNTTHNVQYYFELGSTLMKTPLLGLEPERNFKKGFINE